MRQNRVDPLGRFISTEARGTLWGNRGALHNDQQEILRIFKLEQWITCTLDYKGIRRQIMAPNRLTELFFLDEATSFSAGHRPCALCRRPAYNHFKAAWIKGNPDYGFTSDTSIRAIDHVMHLQRIRQDKDKKTFSDYPASLPDGSFLIFENLPHVLYKNYLHFWTPFGYENPRPIPRTGKYEILTPESVVNAFRAGYTPAVSVK